MLINKSRFNIPKTPNTNKMNLFKKRKLNLITCSFFIVLIDQLSKLALLRKLGVDGSKNVIPNLLNFTLVKNKGAAFSLFSNSTTLLTITSIFASFLLITIIIKLPPRSYWNTIGFIYLLGGTLGNGIDRLFKGYVIDFIELVHINFPIFNIADISINIAIACFIIDQIKTKNKSRFLLEKNSKI